MSIALQVVFTTGMVPRSKPDSRTSDPGSLLVAGSIGRRS